LRAALDLSHSQVQTLLACVGTLKGYDVFVPASDIGRLDWSLAGRFNILEDIPSGFDPVRSVLSEIDVTWVESGRNTIAALFEVEHSTTVYSGLLTQHAWSSP
jgi:type II restriction enzyme